PEDGDDVLSLCSAEGAGVAIVPSLIQGRIVYPIVPIHDPQGRNPKPGRPFVVISRNEEIAQEDRVLAVGITGELDQSPADHCVELPHGPRCKTGLSKPSAALCTWLIDI